MADKVVYFYDPKTGAITSTTSVALPDDHEFLRLPNTVVSHGGYFPAVRTVTHHDDTVQEHQEHVDAGWSFVLDENGLPAVGADGNHRVRPPDREPTVPNVHQYLLRALVNAGHLTVDELHPEMINELNWAFAAAGKSPLVGTKLVAKPVHAATCISVHLVKAS